MTVLALSRWAWAASGVLCGPGLLVAIRYLVLSRRTNTRQGIWKKESAAAFVKRMRRRRLGAALLAAVCVAFPAGLALLEPRRWPVGYMMYWMIVLVMLVWLMGLGLVDLWQTQRMFRTPNEDHESKC